MAYKVYQLEKWIVGVDRPESQERKEKKKSENLVIREKTKAENSITDCIQKKQLKRFGHVQRMGTRDSRVILNLYPRGKRKMTKTDKNLVSRSKRKNEENIALKDQWKD